MGIVVGFGVGIKYHTSPLYSNIINPPQKEETWMFEDGTDILWEDNTEMLVEQVEEVALATFSIKKSVNINITQNGNKNKRSNIKRNSKRK